MKADELECDVGGLTPALVDRERAPALWDLRVIGDALAVLLREPDRRRPISRPAITRERTLLLILPREVFLEAIQRDLRATLRQRLRPCARLAASV